MDKLDTSLKNELLPASSPLLLWGLWLMWLPFLIPVSVILLQKPHSFNSDLQIFTMLLFVFLYGLTTWRGSVQLTKTLRSFNSLQISKNALRNQIIFLGLLIGCAIAVTLTQGAMGAGSFIFTSAALSSRVRPLRAALIEIGALLLLSFITELFIPISGVDIAQNFFLIAVVGITTMSFIRTIIINYELRIARREIVHLVVAEERLRFARDLHDLLGHTLSLITLKSELAKQLISEDPQQAQQEIVDIEKSARAALIEVRETVSGYRQSSLSNELQGTASLLHAAGIQCSIINPAAILPASVENVLTWVVREGTTNVVRHSKAKQCAITISNNTEHVHLTISDDGVGTALTNLQSGYGLHGMKERVAALNGQCEYGSLPRSGFQISVQIPLLHKAS